MAALNLFQWEDMTATVQKFIFPNFFFVNAVPGEPVQGTVATWDIEKPVIAIDTNFVGPTGSATPARMDDVGKQTVAMPLTFVFTTINAGDYTSLRQLGSTQRDVRANQVLARHLKSIKRRYGDYLSEWMISQMFTGTLSITMNGATRVVDYMVPTSHLPTAAASWATAGTNILADLETWVSLVEQDYGATPTKAITNRTTHRYFMRNTDIINFFGQTAPAVAMMQAGKVPTLMGLDFQLVTGRFAAANQTEGFMSSFVATDRVLITPDFDQEWISLMTGTVDFPPMGAARMTGIGDFDEAQGPVAWHSFNDNPPGVNVYYRHARLPVLKNTTAYVFADVVP